MLIRLTPDTDRAPLQAIAEKSSGVLIQSPRADVVAMVGALNVTPAELLKLIGVQDVAAITTPFKLSSRQFAPDDHVVD
ncbi:MAG: hypothetical protein ACYTDT_05845, partial [Planctomycetota bacterium]